MQYPVQSRAPSTASRVDGKAASLLYFDGRPQAHGLFEYLLHESMGPSEAVDVPTLMAPVPYIGACLHQLTPHVSTASPPQPIVVLEYFLYYLRLLAAPHPLHYAAHPIKIKTQQ